MGIEVPYYTFEAFKSFDVVRNREIYQYRLQVGLVRREINFLDPKNMTEMMKYAHQLKRSFGRPGQL